MAQIPTTLGVVVVVVVVVGGRLGGGVMVVVLVMGGGEGKCSPPVATMIVYVSIFRVIRKSLMGILRREVLICKFNVSRFGPAVRR